MKVYFTILMMFFSLVLYSQEHGLELDTLLKNQINELIEDDHGVFFSGDSNPIKDLNYFRELIKKQSNFNVSNSVDGNSTILILKAKDSKLKLTQIKTTAFTNVNKTKVERYNYLIKDGKTKISIEFDENGIIAYQINKKRSAAMRESIIIFIDGFDETKFEEDIEIAKKKYLK